MKTTHRAKAEHLVARWASRVAYRLEAYQIRPGRHPLAGLAELAIAVTSSESSAPVTAAGTESRRYAGAPAAPIESYFIPDDKSDRILEAVGMVSHGVDIRRCLFLWGMGYSVSDIAGILPISRKTIEKRLESGFCSVEALLFWDLTRPKTPGGRKSAENGAQELSGGGVS